MRCSRQRKGSRPVWVALKGLIIFKRYRCASFQMSKDQWIPVPISRWVRCPLCRLCVRRVELWDGGSFKVSRSKPFNRKRLTNATKKENKRERAVYMTRSSTCHHVLEVCALCICVWECRCARKRACVCVCYLYFVMLNLLVLLGRHFLRWWYKTAAEASSTEPWF